MHTDPTSTGSPIDGQDPAAVDTPLQPLFAQILSSPLWAAPRSEPLIRDIIAQYDIRLLLDLEIGSFIMWAKSDPKGTGSENRIVVGLGAFERIWAFIFAYTHLFLVSAEHGTKLVNIAETVNGPEALRLLRWALSDQHAQGRQPWPEGAPSPSKPLADAGFMKRVADIFMVVTGWLLLHELGHFILGHMSGADKPEDTPDEIRQIQEFGADRWASKTSLKGSVDLEYQQRVCLIPLAIGTIAAIEFLPGRTHPSLNDRLTKYFQEFIAPLESSNRTTYTTALATAIVPLQALLYARGQLQTQTTYQSWQIYLDDWESRMKQSSQA